ncbi:glycosyltransferase family 41 protein [Acrodontium crateriforme]|uniref:protein O-GlcNAc transferase n=1 Tax=Acrodontium crateriforme TaxID=150365 RepID=A0AAQ3R755_9PEZI|nr:glycosyltransferase family 41 protein [Acrodontium crateriforme]
MSADVAKHSSLWAAERNPEGTSSLDSEPNPMPYLTRQYALPIHRGELRHNSDLQESGEITPRAENTLRRKTPNGTLNSGYDSAAEYSQPQKHQIIPLTGTFANYAELPGGDVKRSFIQHQQQRQSNGSAVWNSHGQGNLGRQHRLYQPPQAQTTFPVMDSMLLQAPTQYFSAQQYYGQTVPSVIQPSFQYIGPTASGGQGSGPYGPYWHDGTFVPYRPAAIRDPRFYHHGHDGNYWQRSLPSAQLAHQGQTWPQNGTAQNQWPQIQGFNRHAAAAVPTYPVGFNHQVTVRPNQYHNVTSVGHPQGSMNFSQPISQHTTPTPNQQSPLEFGPDSVNAESRDRTFDWALQQYRDLLMFIHQTRRQQFHHRNSQGQSVSSLNRPAFYPKPPKPPTSWTPVRPSSGRTMSDGQGSTRNASSQTESNREGARLDISGNQHSQSSWGSRGQGSPRRRSSHGQYESPGQHWSAPVQDSANKFRTIRRSSGSSVGSILPGAMDDAPLSRAGLALAYMNKLCDEADQPWTDGMHLSGCLAYGLGNYQQAHKWYTKVLDIDSRHLEATSNLAATLLALGRRRDAEYYWMKVVKAAPNHFEAVEHLVGLLCHGQRSKDAIRVIEHVEKSLKYPRSSELLKPSDRQSECSSSTASRSPGEFEPSDTISYDFEADGDNFTTDWKDNPSASEPGFGSSGFSIPGCDNGRILALIHAKGNMLYSLGDNGGAARAFEDAVLIAAGKQFKNIQGLVTHILTVVISSLDNGVPQRHSRTRLSSDPILLSPDQALATAKLCFSQQGELPGLQHIVGGRQSLARKAVISTTSNSLLSMAKIFQDSMSAASRAVGVTPLACGVRDILALYYLSLSLQPSPSTANNVGILLASVQQQVVPLARTHQKMDIPGVVPGSGIALALQYYNYGLQLDQSHAHLYTNLGSLLKDIGQLDAAISMYERAVKCDGKFDIALANLANAVKDKGRISDAIRYYKRAVEVSPEFAEAVCGLANTLNSVCGWQSRGGIAEANGERDAWHVNAQGMPVSAKDRGVVNSGWISRVVDIVKKQLTEGETWGLGTLNPAIIEDLVQQIMIVEGDHNKSVEKQDGLRTALIKWSGQKWEGAHLTRLIERATKRATWRWYQDLYVTKEHQTPKAYQRPRLPASLTVPTAPTVLPFHTFTCPMSAEQIRLISQRNGLRISVSALKAPWLPAQVYPPPAPPSSCLRVGYVSSDFNNHPLAHLMQSVFGLHDTKRVAAYCYATTVSDDSVHRRQIEAEAPVFHDASAWSVEMLVNQIVKDGIHILVNLNGYTRGARNEVFAARPAPIQMSFMGFAGTLGAEWCDYLLADDTAVPPDTLRPWRRNVDIEDRIVDENDGGSDKDWVYSENLIYCRDTFFCCDHRQSAPDAREKRISWADEQSRRWQMRKELFPQISDHTIIFGNFNQLYKIDPTTFRTWLRILARVPNAILWLLRFPDLGESHLLATARLWGGAEVASRVIFTDVAPKHLHISRARVCDVVLDTAECNAHTTAADVLWSGTPLLTLPRYPYKMCSRMAASILKGALPKNEAGKRAEKELIAQSEQDYEEKAVGLGLSLKYSAGCQGKGNGRLMELREMLFNARWSSALFDTKRWVRDLEDAYDAAWQNWVQGKGGDIWLDQIPRGRQVA